MNEVEYQKELIQKGNPKIEIVKSCMINGGIVKIADHQHYEKLFSKSDKELSFFIPASGSGSRMFQFLYDFLNHNENSDAGKVELFINKLEEFAFFGLLPEDVKKSIREHDFNITEIVDYIVQESGLGFGSKPKALIPFHKFGPFTLNPLQEHVLQGIDLDSSITKFHFTVSEKFKSHFIHSINSLEELIGAKLCYELSVQDPDTDSLVFDTALNPVKNEDGSLLKRPSGHGALIKNLNKIETDIVFIKNIDNIQHYSNSSISKQGVSLISGVLIEVQNELFQLSELSGDAFKDQLVLVNNKFQLFNPDELESATETEIKNLLNRPVRVCGMVRNEGQPGGGPFWVKDNAGNLSKQIVEKSQIDLKSNQFKILAQSTHFNPVFMALGVKDKNGDKIDLEEFIKSDEYFIVNKSQKGQQVQFVERPGLWNGGMYYWNTVFVELNPSVFTPVKTILDLLKPLHF